MGMNISDNDATIIMLVVALLVCAACIYSLGRSTFTRSQMKLAATTQRTFVGLTLASALCSVIQASLPLAPGKDTALGVELVDTLRVVMDFWTNTYLMIFWLKVHFFVRYRSEKTLSWLWWAWAILNMVFMVFQFTISALIIIDFVNGDYTEKSYYVFNVSVNVIAYTVVPMLVAGFGYQLYQLFRRWGRAFSPALSATLRRIALGTTVVCACFLLRALVLILVLADVFSGQVPAAIYLFYFIGLTAIPQFIALYIMAILLPNQVRDSEERDSKENSGEYSGMDAESSRLSRNFRAEESQSPARRVGQGEPINGADDDEADMEEAFTEDQVWRTWSMRHDGEYQGDHQHSTDVADG